MSLISIFWEAAEVLVAATNESDGSTGLYVYDVSSRKMPVLGAEQCVRENAHYLYQCKLGAPCCQDASF
eukprot:934865-Amphidinium_carterae.1